MIGWMLRTATRKPFQTPQARPTSRQQQRPASELPARSIGRDRAADGDDRADRQVDAFGGDDQRHADGQKSNGSAAVENVDHAAIEPAVLNRYVKKLREHNEIQSEE
jgi:hypothetical protein